MQLAHLSTDAMSLITRLLHYLDVCNLWFVGCKALNTKLAAGGVSQLEVLFNANFRRFSWAPMLFEFRQLVRFSFNQEVDVAIPPITTAALASISNTIQELELYCPGAFGALSDIFEQPGAMPSLTALDLTVSEHEKGQLEGMVIRWPATLLRLTLCATNFDLDIKTLPPHLTALDATVRHLINTTETSHFPASLIFLELDLERITCEPFGLLPSSLQHLSIHTTDSDGNVDDQQWDMDLAKLPRGLTYLDLPIWDCSREDVEALPRTLKTLEVIHGAEIARNDFDVLPPYLVSGPIGLHAYPITKDVVENVPRNMKRLMVAADALPHLKPTCPNLSVIFMGANREFEKEMNDMHMETLSPFITSIRTDYIDDFVLKALPSTLTHLSLGKSSLNSDQLLLLPRNLKALEVPNMLEEDWQNLPPKLETLQSSQAKHSSSQSSTCLPRTLRELLIGGEAEFPIDWFKGLPSGLRTLSVSFCPPTMADTANSCCRLSLPPQLSTFFIKISKKSLKKEMAREVLVIIISSLPPTVASFNLAFEGHEYPPVPYTASDLSALPKRLQHLHLTGVVTKPSEVNALLAVLPLTLLSTAFGFQELWCTNKGTYLLQTDALYEH